MGYKSVVHVNTQKVAGTANTDTLVITKPTGLVVNDLMWAYFLSALDAVTAPSGWTQYDSDDSTNMRSVVFYKVATSSDVAATNFTFTAASALGPFCGGISAYRNVDTSNIVNIAGQSVLNTTTNPVTTPGVTSTQPGLAIHYWSNRIASTAISTYTASGVTERADFGNHGNSTAYSMAWYDSGTTVVAGSISGVAITSNGSVTQSIARTIVLQALSLNSTDSATGTDSATAATVVVKSSSDSVTGTEAQGATGKLSVDINIATDTNAIVATPPVQLDLSSAAETHRLNIVDTDSVAGVSEIGSIRDVNHPVSPDTASGAENQSIVASLTNLDIWLGREYGASPAGATPVQIRDYKATLIMGPADVYVADFGAIEPVGLGVTIAPPSIYWTHLGGIYKGVQLHVEHEWEEFLPKNISDRGTRRLKKRRLSAAMELAEPTLDNILLGVDNGSITSGVGYRTYTPPATVDRATPLTYKAIIVHGWAPGLRPDGTQKRRMIIMRKCLSIESIAMTYSKTDQTTVPITWAVHRVSNNIAPFVIIDET